MNNTNPQTEVKCCDGECNHDDCCGKIPENCTHKESPVSQSVEGWEKEFDRQFPFAIIDWKIGKENDGDGTATNKMKEIKDFISTTLSTLVKEMEGLISELCECQFPDEQMNRCRNCKKVIEDKRTANEGISAAQEVVKKMGV